MIRVDITSVSETHHIGRTSVEPARYLQHSLAAWSRILRAALIS